MFPTYGVRAEQGKITQICIKVGILAIWATIAHFVLGAGAASAQLLANKSFSPVNIAPGATSTLTIQLFNNTQNIATSVSLTDNLPISPAGLTVASGGVLSNTCGGSAVAVAGSSAVNLSGGTVAASVAGVAGSCAITVQVVGNPPAAPASYNNTIPTTNVSSSIGGTSSPASATLNVLPLNPVTGSKTFVPANFHGNGPAVRMTIQLNNTNSYDLTAAAFTDTFPAQMQLSATPNVVSSCGGTVTAPVSGLSLSLSGGTIPASGNCTINVDMVARDPNTIAANGNYTNSIAANNVTTAQGATNPAAISRSVTVQKGTSATSVFTPSSIAAGGTSSLTITLTNFNATAIPTYNFTDNLPAGVTIVGPTSTTCGGTLSNTASSITVTGGNLATAPAAVGGSTCTITAVVTAPTNGSYTNSIPAGNLGGVAYSASSSTLLVSPVTVGKAFTITSVPQTGVTTLSITFTNRSTLLSATITSFTDNLTTMGTGLNIAAAPAATTTCGGTLTATAGSTLITLTGGTIPVAPSATVFGTCTISVPVQVAIAATLGTHTNTIAVNGMQTSLGNNTATATAAISVVAPLTASKAFAPATVVGGTVTRLTITLTRAINAALFTNMSMSDTLPSGLTIAPTPNATTTCSSGVITAVAGSNSVSLSGANLGTVVTSSASCTVAVNVLATTINGSYTNTISIGGVTASTALGAVSNQTAATATATIIAGITLNKNFSPTNITPGDTSRITVYISNPSSAGINLTGAALTDSLPAGLVVKSPANATFIATSGTCTATITAVPGAASASISSGSISSGAQCQFAFDVTTNAVGSLTNTLPANTMTSTQGQTNGNVASATLVSSGSADVSITKTDGVTTTVAGTSTTYTLVIKNNSTALSVAGLPVNDPEPAGVTFTGWSCVATSGSSCAATSGTGPLSTTATLAALGTATYTITALSASTYTDPTITNIATVDPAAAGVFDPVSTNNSASDVDQVTRTAELSVTKSNGSSTVNSGGTTSYTLIVNNSGPSAATGTLLSDPAVSGLTVTSVSCAATPGQCTIGTTPTMAQLQGASFALPLLDSGQSFALTVVATVTALNGNVTNAATITIPSGITDPTAGNNSASDTDTVTPLPTVTLRKISTGGVGAFDFTGDNGLANQTLTTTAAGTAVTGTAQSLTSASTVTTITEAIPSGYAVTNISCSGLGSGGAMITDLAAGKVTLDAAATAPGANITCVYSNFFAISELKIEKTSNLTGPLVVGNLVTYTYKVENTGNVPISTVNIVETAFTGTGTTPAPGNESLLTDISPSGDSAGGAPNDGVWDTLAPGDIITFTATYAVSQQDIDSLQ